MSPVLNESSAIRHFEGSDAIEICDGITFDFYTGLPHVVCGGSGGVHVVCGGSGGVHVVCGGSGGAGVVHMW